MVKAYSGATGAIKISGVGVMFMSGWNVNMQTATISVPTFGDTYEKTLPTINSWDASSDGAAAFSPGSGQKAMFDAYISQQRVLASLYLDNLTYVEGYVYITSFTISTAAADYGKVSCSFKGDGAPSMTVSPKGIRSLKALPSVAVQGETTDISVFLSAEDIDTGVIVLTFKNEADTAEAGITVKTAPGVITGGYSNGVITVADTVTAGTYKVIATATVVAVPYTCIAYIYVQ